MSITHKIRQAVAGASAASLLAMGLFLTVPTASATTANGPDQPNAEETGTLIINKRLGIDGEAGDGTVMDPVPGEPLAGVTFTYYQVGVITDGACTAIDTSKVADWDNVPTGTAPASAPAGTAEGDLCTVDTGTAADPTDANGVSTISGLPLGLYYVQETDAPEGITKEALPFYVSIPMPNPKNDTATSGDEWLYTVNVYPKNEKTDTPPTKTINATEDQAGFKVGDTVQYTITQTVPVVAGTYTSASIIDRLPAGELEYDDTVSVKINGTDATYTYADGKWSLTGDSLKNLKPGDTFEVVFNAKVLKVTETGRIDNKPLTPGTTTPGYGSEFNGNEIPGEPTPYTYWGQLIVNKIDPNGAKLKGAQFAVGLPGADGQCPDAAPETPIATGTSDASGVVQWNANPTSPLGLFVANSNDGELSDPSKNYCVYETEAPAGYTGLNGAQLVNIKPGTQAALSIDIENKERDTPDLPLTGAQGTALLTVLGLGLAGAGVAAVAISRRRQEAR